MVEAWFTGLAEELAQCLLDAELCAVACESLLESVRHDGDEELLKDVVDALVAPAAVARVLVELIDQPPDLVLAACRLCREVTSTAADQLVALGPRIDGDDTIGALRASAGSCGRLLAAA